VKTTLEISATRLAENFRAVSRVAGEGASVLAVVKADAYGHGATLCAPALVDAGAHRLGVGDVEEGAAVRHALGSRDARILVMCGMELADASAMVEHGLTPVVWTAAHVEAMEAAARTAGRPAAVHLKIDSGMSRQGAQPGEPLGRVAARLAASRWITCEGVLTHLASSEEADSPVTAMQQGRFAEGLRQVLAASLRPEWLHMANSSALDEGSTTGWMHELAREHRMRVLVRTGLAVYGHCLPLEAVSPVHAPVMAPCLQPVLRWKTVVIGLREIAAGERVGYGATWKAPGPTRLALLPVGYADGFRRGASSGLGDGWVVIAGQRAPVVGRVSMNLTTVDVTTLNDVREGGDVTLLGEGVSVQDHAQWNGTIPYEILCGLHGHRVLV
jgi:alanine racemase